MELCLILNKLMENLIFGLDSSLMSSNLSLFSRRLNMIQDPIHNLTKPEMGHMLFITMKLCQNPKNSFQFYKYPLPCKFIHVHRNEKLLLQKSNSFFISMPLILFIAVSSMLFDCGGLIFPACAFSGW